MRCTRTPNAPSITSLFDGEGPFGLVVKLGDEPGTDLVVGAEHLLAADPAAASCGSVVQKLLAFVVTDGVPVWAEVL